MLRQEHDSRLGAVEAEQAGMKHEVADTRLRLGHLEHSGAKRQAAEPEVSMHRV